MSIERRQILNNKLQKSKEHGHGEGRLEGEGIFQSKTHNCPAAFLSDIVLDNHQVKKTQTFH